MKQNRLANEASPYLLQHADNPVDWWPWGPDALAEADRTGRPILLSVGYAACHWCHVMAHESFEDEATAAVMNERFVNIKVDREERPDIDQIYMAALHATGEQGGWPLTMFLTPKGEPFFGGTYFPKDARYGRARFVDVLHTVADAHRDRATMVTENVEALRDRIDRPAEPCTLPGDACAQAVRQLLPLLDTEHGGTRGAPKFPNAGLFELLWRDHARTGSAETFEAVHLGLTRIALGGITDHIGGGMARYSVDERWLVPHFEKMLYDNAQIITLMSDVYARTRDPLFERWTARAIGWAEREMCVDGLYAASLDADSEGEEGRFYVWSLAEVRTVLGPDTDRFAHAFDISETGNFEGANVLNRLPRRGVPTVDEDATFVDGCLDRLFLHREARVRPARDDKLLCDWNALMIAALAVAGSAFARPQWHERAARAYATARDRFSRSGRLIHAVRGPSTLDQGFALDHAAMMHAALTLLSHGVGVDERDLLADALADLDIMERHYRSEAGGYYWTADDADALYMRPSSPNDEAVPNANGMMVRNCSTLWALTGDDAHEMIAARILRAHAGAAATNVFSCASLFNGLDQLQRLASVTTDAPAHAAAVRAAGHPAAVVLSSVPRGHPAAAEPLPTGSSILCRRGVCSLPMDIADDVVAALWSAGPA